MKLSKKRLRSIIREELTRVLLNLNEGSGGQALVHHRLKAIEEATDGGISFEDIEVTDVEPEPPGVQYEGVATMYVDDTFDGNATQLNRELEDLGFNAGVNVWVVVRDPNAPIPSGKPLRAEWTMFNEEDISA